MSTQLEEKLNKILAEKKEKILPENIRKGTKIFDVEGSFETLDTSDATATGDEILEGETAYVNGVKIVGSIPKITASKPGYLYGEYKTFDIENPFVLIRVNSQGDVNGEILTIEKTVLDSSWIENKNICLRCFIPDSGTKQISVQLATTEWGNRFQFYNSNGSTEMNIHCKNVATNQPAPYTLYNAKVSNLTELNTTSWEKREVSASNYLDESFGKITNGKIYGYSRDITFGHTGGLTGSYGIPGVADKVVLKKTINFYTPSKFVEKQGILYEYINQNQIAKAIDLKPEDIVQGKTYLGINGATKKYDMNIESIAELTEEYTGPVVIDSQAKGGVGGLTSLTCEIAATQGCQVVAVIAARGAITVPEGWKLVHSNSCISDNIVQTAYVYTKIADADNVSFTVTCATAGRLLLTLLSYDEPYDLELIKEDTGDAASYTIADTFHVGDVLINNYILTTTNNKTELEGTKCTIYRTDEDADRLGVFILDETAEKISITNLSTTTTPYTFFLLRFNKPQAFIPENIRKGVKILNIEGEMEEGIDTSDATALPEDICMNKTAYVNGEKITGTLWEAGITNMLTNDIVDDGTRINIKKIMDQDYLFRKGGSITYHTKYEDMANAIGLTPEKIMKGNNVIGVSGNATSDADATAEDIVKGKTAYVNGEKVVGTYEESGENNNYNATISAEGKTSFTVTSGLRQLKSIDVQGVTSLYSAFKNCASLTKIEEILNTTQVTNTSYMFEGCVLLEEIPYFDTSNVTSATYMFQKCQSIKTIPLLDTSKVTSTNGMFNSCSALETVPLLDLSSCTDVSAMFPRCTNLKEIPLFDISNATNTGGMLQFCSSLETIPLLDVSKSTSMQNFFYQCKALKSIPKLNTSNNTSMYYMFYECYAITDIPELDASNVNNLTGAFYCPKLTNFGGLKNIGKSYTRASANYSTYEYSLSNSSNLTHESLINVMNGVYDLNLTYDVANGGTLYTQKIKLGSTNLAKLTAEEIAIATNKGWTVS